MAIKILQRSKTARFFIEMFSKTQTTSNGRARVKPPQIILEVVPDEQGRKQVHYIWSNDAQDRDISWRDFKKLVAEAGWSVDLSSDSCRENSQQVARQLLKLWPS